MSKPHPRVYPFKFQKGQRVECTALFKRFRIFERMFVEGDKEASYIVVNEGGEAIEMAESGLRSCNKASRPLQMQSCIEHSADRRNNHGV